MPGAPELTLAFIDRAAAALPPPLQEAKGDQTAAEVVELSSFRARLTARRPKLILIGSNDLF
jgi:hypothetical protein